MLSSLSNLIEENEASFAKITNSINHLKRKIKTTLDVLSKDQEHFGSLGSTTRITDNVKILKDLLTNTPIDRNDKSKVIVKQGKVTYTKHRKAEINTCISTLENELFLLKNNIIYL